MEKENKEDRFKRVAEKRVQNVLNGIRSLSQCANPRVYAWKDEQLEKIWTEIDRELSRCKDAFDDPAAGRFRL